MSFWKRQKPSPAPPSPEPVAAAPPPVAPPPPPELDQLAELLPERDANGRFFWQDYVDRLTHSFDGLPAPDGGASFVRQCLASGCKAVPAIGRRDAWERRAPPAADRKGRAVFEVRLRLGLFFAASLRYLVHGACRLRVKAGDAEWNPLPGYGPTFRAFQAASDRKPDITWLEVEPDFGQACLLANALLQIREATLLSFDLARDVYDHVLPRGATGLFSVLLSDGGRVKAIDVAGVFLKALVQAARDKRLRLNTRRNGHVFVTPTFWFVTYPAGVGDVARWIRRRRQGPQHDFVRDQIVEALRTGGCLLGVDTGGKGSAIQKCEVDSDAWVTPLALNGLLVRADRLPGRSGVPPFDGTVTLKESGGGGASGNQTE